jgi:hypothetical protein
MSLQGALLEYCLSAAHIYKDGICTSVCSSLGVSWITGAEYLAFSSLIGAILRVLVILLADDIYLVDFSMQLVGPATV